MAVGGPKTCRCYSVAVKGGSSRGVKSAIGAGPQQRTTRLVFWLPRFVFAL